MVGALYLDGGFDVAQNFVLSFLPTEIDIKKIDSLTDYKTKLQETIQKIDKTFKIEYILAKETGPDHDKSFEISLKVNKTQIGYGIGKSKKRAEQNAAKDALSNIQSNPLST